MNGAVKLISDPSLWFSADDFKTEDAWLKAQNRTRDVIKASNSIFLSYGWDSAEHKEWVHELSIELIERGFLVVTDQIFRPLFTDIPKHAVPHFAAGTILVLGLSCKMAIIVMSERYAETSLLGQTGMSEVASFFPSFVVPQSLGKGTLDNAFKKIFRYWEVLSWHGVLGGASFSELKNNPDCLVCLDELPEGVRQFRDGWGGFDEFQGILLNMFPKRVSCILKSGSNYLSPIPTWDWREVQNVSDALDQSLPPSNDNARMLKDHTLTGWQQSYSEVLVVRPSDDGKRVISSMVSPVRDWEIYKAPAFMED